MKPCDTKRQVTTPKIKWYKSMIHILRKNSTCGCVDLKTTHQLKWVQSKSSHACPLPWGNKNLQSKMCHMEIKNYKILQKIHVQH
jgi:hypothetical protein